VRRDTGFATIGASSCSGCHREQISWWRGDRHFRTAEPLLSREYVYEQVARNYGLSPDEMVRGDSVCMDCHGTVVTGRESEEVGEGVSCESCHGGASSWLEPHKVGDKSLGSARPGYANALRLGMRELADTRVMATTCVECHYINTPPQLVATGHPVTSIDLTGKLEQVRHWARPLPSAGELERAFGAAKFARGPVPPVERPLLSRRPPPSAGAKRASTLGMLARRAPRRPGPAPTAVSSCTIRPFPPFDEEVPPERRLIELKERLEYLATACETPR
jgi:hypothetical protein